MGPASLPRIRPYAIPAGTTPGGARQGASGGARHRGSGGALGSEYLLGALSSVLVSATEHLLSPDIRYSTFTGKGGQRLPIALPGTSSLALHVLFTCASFKRCFMLARATCL